MIVEKININMKKRMEQDKKDRDNKGNMLKIHK